jgi:hypothetical protein
MSNRRTPIKKRSQSAYNNKVKNITKWYNRLMEARKKELKINPNNHLPYKRAELKDLEYYINKIKKVVS